jgi:hypothetical protein
MKNTYIAITPTMTIHSDRVIRPIIPIDIQVNWNRGRC